MRNLWKHVCSVALVILVLASCKKGPGPDYRDALVGQYKCAHHFYSYSWGTHPAADSVIGQKVINVSGVGNDTTKLNIGDSLFTLYSTGTRVILLDKNYCTPLQATFYASDSLKFNTVQTCVFLTGSGGEYYVGTKIH